MGVATDLIAALGTIATTLIALFLLRQGQVDRREVQEERKKEQARGVTCWCDWNPDSPEVTVERPHIASIFVRNTSEQAIYQAFVDYYHPQTGLERIDVGPVPPAETRHRDVVAEIPDDLRWEPSALLPTVYFTDANGYPWTRTMRGRLARDPGPHRDGFSEEGGRPNLGLPRPKSSGRPAID
jgi:hypothetical protein